MLSYVHTDLAQGDIKNIQVEEFDNMGDILAVILFKIVSKQIKRGLIKEYVPKSEELETLRGKVNLTESMKLKISNKNKLYCEFDNLSVNNYLNRIIKTTIYILILSKDLSPENKKNLKKLIFLFSDVDLVEVKKIRWTKIKNKNYRVIINICYLILND